MTAQSSMDFWIDKWDTGDTRWHLPEVNQKLVKYLKTLFNGRKDGTVFIPLCGKSVDMKWLYDQGYQVMGLDCCEAPIKEFFQENNLPCQRSKIEIGVVYQTPDKRLKIYCTDILKLNKEICGPITSIWDRGSLVAVDKEFRKPYAALLKSLVAPDFRYLLDVYHYNDWFVSGPPRNIPPQLVTELFEDTFEIQHLEQRDITDAYECKFHVKPVYNDIYLMTMKKSAQ